MAQQIKKSASEIALIALAIAAIWYASKILTFNSLSESESKTWLDVSEALLIVSTILLTLGLLGEWPDSDSWKKRLIYKVAKASVILGVVGELLGDGGIFETSRRLQGLQDAAVADAQKETAKANRATEELRRQNLELETNLEKLRDQMAWHPLDKEKASKLVSRLKGQRIDLKSLAFTTNAHDPGPLRFCESVRSALKDAGVILGPCWEDDNFGGAPGLTLFGNGSTQELDDAFAEIGFPLYDLTRSGVGSPPASNGIGGLELLVGAKPLVQ
jgi:hypothetical protein